MGFMMLMADCFCCGRTFMSNPNSVPSYRNNPICRSCVEVINARLKADGKAEFKYPEDAYEPQEVD